VSREPSPETNHGSLHQIGKPGKSGNFSDENSVSRDTSSSGQVAATYLNGWLSLKESYMIKYDNDPVEELKKADTILGVALVVNF